MFSNVDSLVGHNPFNDWFVPDTTQRHVLGLQLNGVDPFWGWGEFLYVKSNDAILKGSLVAWDELYQGTLLPSTANQGFPFGVAMNAMASGTFGWLQIAGYAVYQTNATVAADAAMAVAAAGIAGTNVAGKQLLNFRNRKAATATKTFTNTQTYNGLNILYVPNGYDGVFLGMALSGTGIPASTVAAALDPDGKRIYMGTAVGTATGKTATATGSITLTGTFTGFGAGQIQYPLCQGAIT
jgi:hypothetical protein